MSKKYYKKTKVKDISKLKIKYLEYYSSLPIQRLAADFIGKDEDTVIRWKNKDKNFADLVASAKSAWALDKVGKIRSTEWLLERVMKEHFAEKKEIDSNVNLEVEAALDRMAKMLPE